MSVDVTTGIAYGYLIDESDIEKAASLAQVPIDVLIDILHDTDMIITLNGYSLDGEYILGFDINMCHIEPTHAVKIPSIFTCINLNQISELSCTKNAYFSFLKEEQPSLLLYSKLW